MKIVIQENGHKIRVPLPTCLLLNPLTARIATEVIQRVLASHQEKWGFQLTFTASQITALFRELCHYRGLEIVNIIGSDGESVRIVL